MHPSQRFSYALLISLALWFPTLQTVLRGGIDPLGASVRWVLAFAVASAGVRLLGSLVDRYAVDEEQDELDELAQQGLAVDGLDHRVDHRVDRPGIDRASVTTDRTAA